MAGQSDAFILLILACICPPAAVAFVAGCGADLCLNILLTLLGYFPGCLHAFWLVLRRAEANERYGYKNWTYHGMGEYVPSDQGPPSAQSSAQHWQAQGAPPPPPPPGQYPAPPPTQAPVDQKGGYKDAPPPPPAPAESKDGYQADQKSGYTPSQAPAEQKYGYQAPPQPPAQPTAPSSST
ncbi:hypothetical protein HD554DRAFT_440070 [Boletus coccyginus]|nr:hypothetical protein HD554DRAFT_440070 [Boletus coccyginus]